MTDWTHSSDAPTGPGGGPLPVAVQLYIHSISELDSVVATFRADFYLVFTWTAPAPPTGGERVAWWPKFELMNAKEVELPYSAVEHDGERWKHTIRAVGTFKIIGMAGRLADFPFDSQYLVVDMSFWDTADRLALVMDRGRVARTESGPFPPNFELRVAPHGEEADPSGHMMLSRSIDLPEWETNASEAAMRTFSHEYATDMFGRHPRLQWDLPVRRKHGYYFSKILSVAVTCNVICGAAFFAPVDNIDARISIAVTIFLALVAFQFVVMESLPRTPKQTRIDWFFVASYLFATFVAVVSVVLAFLDLDPDVATFVNWLFFGLYVLCNVKVVGRMLEHSQRARGESWEPLLEAHEEREAVTRFFSPAPGSTGSRP